jgi:hypothetical protein
MLMRNVALVATLILSMAGCSGSGVDLGEVRGKVTMDGQPLPDALVRFVPDKGRSAQGITDANGEYKLDYSNRDAGALVGKSKVLITTGSLENPKAEKVPAKYNNETELTGDVTSGSNTINFDLKSQ